jgi:hypothetical protein
MWLIRSVVLVLAVFVTACGETTQTPTAPTPTQTQTPTPAVKLVPLWDTHSEAGNCTSTGDCLWSESIQNAGTGCASGITAVLRLSFDVDPPRSVPSDFRMDMDAVGGGLATKTIRPNETVALLTVDHVPSSVAASGRWYDIDLKWNNVTCP